MGKKLIIVIISLLIIILGSGGAFLYFVNALADKVAINRPIYLTVQPGDSLDKAIYTLEDRGVIKSAFLLQSYFWYQGWEGRLKTGDYTFDKDISPKEVASILITGDKKNSEFQLTIPEGWRAEEINKALNEKGKFSDKSWLEAVSYKSDYSGDYAFLADKPKTASLEGYLFPDTYRFYKDATADEVTRKMLANFNLKLTAQMRTDIKAQNKTIYQIVTMASIIEKEVRSQSDMKVVSGIFWNRIKNKQRLESCASLAYILGVNKAQYTIEDTKINSPYNTYQVQGLPPGPIANPGINAIEAAIYPIPTDYNYFLTASGSGQTIFAKTFEEHVHNKSVYLK